MKRIADFFKRIVNWIAADGLLHLLCSFALVVLLGVFLPIWVAVIVTVVIGIAKEVIYDKLLGKGDASWHDVICDVIGIIVGVAALLLM